MRSTPFKICIGLPALLLAVTTFADTVTRRVELSGISQIRVDGSSELHFSQGDDEYVTITADEELIDSVDARVQGNLLHLSRKREGWRWTTPSGKVRFDVQLRKLTDLSSNGSGDVVFDPVELEDLDITLAGSGDLKISSMKSDDFRLRLTGSGDMVIREADSKSFDVRIMGSGDLDLDRLETASLEITILGSGDMDIDNLKSADLEITINGSGDVKLSGVVDEQRLEVNGSGSIRADKLQSRRADVEVNGSGRVEVRVEEKLQAMLSRSGEITYHGGPHLEVESGGSGKLRKAN